MSETDEEALAEAYNKGLALERAGDIAGAVTAFRRALALDPADPGGVAVRLAALGAGDVPVRAPELYVETLFDQQAEAFEHILVDQLGYGVPALMAGALAGLGLGPFARTLDLGCGTGLVAEALGDRAHEIIGIDLSEAMVDICEAKDIYDGLYQGEIVDFLADNDEQEFDLITAADVLPYLGDLGALFAGVAGNLEPGGVFAFSSETMPAAAFVAREFAVTPHHRFAHREDYVRQALDAAGFSVLGLSGINVRNEEGAPTPGHLVVARLQV